MRPITNKRECCAAALIFVIGLVAVLGGLGFQVGTAARMGPGYFPVLIGVCLIGLSVLMVVTPLSKEDEETEAQQPEYRAWACVAGGIVAFIVLGKYGGLAPATFALVLLSALGDRGNSVRTALLTAAGVTGIAITVFSWGLQMQFPLFRWG